MSAQEIRNAALDKRATFEARILAAIKAADAARSALDALSVVLADIATTLYEESPVDTNGSCSHANAQVVESFGRNDLVCFDCGATLSS